jgi:SRSO17 transposase
VSDLDAGFEQRLERFIDVLGDGLRSDTQRAAFARYVVGLLSDAERKSIEPLAARSRPDAAKAEHHALCYLIAEAPWRDRAVRRAAAAWGLWAATAAGPVRATIVDDTGFLKSGTHSVGVKRQYTGSAGKITNCQVGVSLAVATDYDTVPLDMALYLPWEWTVDEARRAAAKIPAEVEHASKWQLARDMLRAAHADDVPLGDVVLADSDYGRVMAFRTAITDLDLHYGVGVPSTQPVFVNGRVQTAQQVAAAIREVRWKRVTWREGDGPEQWLVLEWRDGEDGPAHFYLSSRPRTWSHGALVAEIKGRWRGERLYEDLKGELGLDHYEGRGWVGWHHHVSVVFCCYALLVAERLVAFPPSALAALRARYYRRAA